MSEPQAAYPIHHDPPIPAWVVPSSEDDLVPLPAMLCKETEHEIVVFEYDRRKKAFSTAERERRAKAYKTFNECRDAMLAIRKDLLQVAKEQAINQASIYSHIESLNPQAFPETPAAPVAEKEEDKPDQNRVVIRSPRRNR